MRWTSSVVRYEGMARGGSLARTAWLAACGLVLLLSAGRASAAPYWVAWEGNDYPENEGWTRRHLREDGPKAERTLDRGAMTLDGLSSIEIVDTYGVERSINPGPGEEFVARWGLRVLEVAGPPNFSFDPGVQITSDDGWSVSLLFGEDEIRTLLDQVDTPFSAGGWHHWELRTQDMRSFNLFLDGSFLRSGAFFDFGPSFGPALEWGDAVGGAVSRSQWDYFGFGVLPDPSSGLGLFILMAICCTRPTRS